MVVGCRFLHQFEHGTFAVGPSTDDAGFRQLGKPAVAGRDIVGAARAPRLPAERGLVTARLLLRSRDVTRRSLRGRGSRGMHIAACHTSAAGSENGETRMHGPTHTSILHLRAAFATQ